MCCTHTHLPRCYYVLYTEYLVIDKEWPSTDDSRSRRSRSLDQLVHKRQAPPGDDCCVNGTKGEKGSQG